MTMVARLVTTHSARFFPLVFGDNVVGRDPGCGVFLDHLTVSRRHATLMVGEQRATIRDESSRNGIFVSRNRITVAELESGVDVAFGSFLCVFQRIDTSFTCGSTASGPASPRIEPSKSPAVSHPILRLQVANLSSRDDSIGITPAERRVFDLLLCGRSEKAIAVVLALSKHTVHNHVRRIYQAFGVHSRSELLTRVLGHRSEMGRG